MANEKRLIDANALLSAIDEYMKNAYGCTLNEVAEFQTTSSDTKVVYMVEGLYEATEIIDEAPTVDAVEVVRCKDCKHWSVDQYGCVCNLHSEKENADYPAFEVQMLPIDFCSYGERKEA